MKFKTKRGFAEKLFCVEDYSTASDFKKPRQAGWNGRRGIQNDLILL